MPHADPAAKRAYMRVYLRERYRSDLDYREAKKVSRRVRGRRLYRENAEYRERVKASAKLWANSQRGKEAMAARGRRRRKDPRWIAYHQSKTREYQARKKRHTPKWLSADDRSQIEHIYLRAAAARRAGYDCEVDHVVPLNGKDICGLHVPWNLRIVPSRYNKQKGNGADELDLLAFTIEWLVAEATGSDR